MSASKGFSLPQLTNGFHAVGPASSSSTSSSSALILGAGRHRHGGPHARKAGSAPAGASSSSGGNATNSSSLVPASSPPPPPPHVESEEAVLQALKEKLRLQEQRLAQAVHHHTPRRPPGSANGPTPRSANGHGGGSSTSPLRGTMYNARPYQGVNPRIMWEPFTSDVEVAELTERINRSEERISSRNKELEHGWRSGGRRSTGASIAPPEPPVFAVKNEHEIMPLVAAAESFAEAAHLRYAMMRQVEDEDEVVTGGAGAAGGGRSGAASGAVSTGGGSGRDLNDSGHSFGDSVLGTGAPSPSAAAAAGLAMVTKSATFDSGVGLSGSGGLGKKGSRRISTLGRQSRGSIMRTDTTTAILQKLDIPSIDITLPSPDEIEIERQGDVLGPQFLLKRDLFEAAFTRRDQVGVMSGAPYFRLVPKFNVGGCAQGHVSGIRTILNEIAKVFKGTIVWVNLREEPVIYINGRAHIIRSLDDPRHPVIIPGITARRLNQMEAKLKNEILKEASMHSGNICVHKETANGSIDLLWEAVEDSTVQTLSEVYDMFESKGLNIQYLRVPIAQGIGPQPADFQFVVEQCQRFTTSPIIYNCQTGRGRSSVMMMITTIVRFYQHCTKDVDMDVSMLKGDGKAFSFRTLLKLISVLPDGALHERRVAVLSELSDKIYNVGDKIHRVFTSGKDVDQAALMRLAQYAYLIVFSCYCEQLLWSKKTTKPFPQWIDEMPEIKLIIQSIMSQQLHAAIPERISTPVGEDSEVANFVRRRRGNVLSSNMVLRSYPKDVIGIGASTVPGVVGLRQISAGCAIYTCGRTTDQGLEDLLYAVRQQFQDIKVVHWINLRAEPTVYINNTPFVLLDYQAVSGEGDEFATMHISAERLEELEAKLRADVMVEADANNGSVLIHELAEGGEVVARRVRVGSVKTPKTVYEALADFNNAKYHRVPFPQKTTLLPEDFDPLIAVLATIGEDDGIVLNDSDGALRTTICANVACLHRFATQEHFRTVRTIDDVRKVLSVQGGNGLVLNSSQFYGGIEEADQFPGESPQIELIVASAMCQMLAAGTFIPALRYLLEFCGRGSRWNLLEAIDEERRLYDQSVGDVKKRHLYQAVSHIRSYLLVLLVAIYIDEVDDVATDKFSTWFDALNEVRNIIDHLDEHPAKSIKYVVSTNLMAAHSMERAVDRRNGNVLTANFGMKADHFPGCQKKGLSPQVPGAPNFRKVAMVNVYGVAIPTKTGVYNVLSVLGACDAPITLYPGDVLDPELYTGFAQPNIVTAHERVFDRPLRGHVLWFNLREEPIIYVGDRPFVFRDLANPYVNVELTGIETSKIESVEVKLKHDIMDESAKYDGKFLVHDEGNPGELVGIWEVANTETVKTVRELYEEAANEGCRVTFVRLPVTDEQSPEHKDFDHLIEHLLPRLLLINGELEEPVSMVFNCQMGRGRTTTGMVVCCLLIGLVCPEYFKDLEERYPKLWEEADSPYAKGNYKCILQLRSVLSDGRVAKRRLDLVLEACNKMQNLRTAIEMFKSQVESPDLPEEARGRAHHHGVNYLRRYFNLIAFTSYLYEEFNRESGRFNSTFAEWMEARAELRHLHDTAALL